VGGDPPSETDAPPSLVAVLSADVSASRRHLAQTAGSIRGVPVAKWGEGPFPKSADADAVPAAVPYATDPAAGAAADAAAMAAVKELYTLPLDAAGVPQMPAVAMPQVKSVCLLPLGDAHAPHKMCYRRMNIASTNSTYEKCAVARRVSLAGLRYCAGMQPSCGVAGRLRGDMQCVKWQPVGRSCVAAL